MAVSVFGIVQDAKGDKSKVSVQFPDATPVAILAALVPAVMALINPLVNGGLVSAGFTVEVDVSGTWGPVAALTSDVQEKGEFVMRTVNGFLKRINLPTFDEAFLTPSTREVDRTDTDVQAWVDFLEDGITVSATLAQPCDTRGEDLVTVEQARENWGRRRL